MDHTGVVSDDAVVLAVVEHDVGIGDAGHRTVQVVDRQGPIGVAAAVIIIEPGIVFREIHRLGVDELRATDGASGTEPRTREQQEGQRARLATVVVLEIHECRVHHIIAVIVIFVAADREVGDTGLGQAAAVGDFLRRLGIADIVGLAHDQRIDQPRLEPFAADVASGRRHANGIVGEFRVAEYEEVAPAPETTIAVLIAGQVLEVRLHHGAIQISRICQRQERDGGQTEGVIFVDVPIEHEAVEVGMGHVAFEGAHRRAARPDGLADVRVLERALRVFGQRQPEAGRVGTGRHIVDEAVVRVGDPERRRRIV